MDQFKIEKCPNNGCNFWRPGDKCGKDSMSIKDQLPYVKYLHYADFCEVRRQADRYRLTKVLEE